MDNHRETTLCLCGVITVWNSLQAVPLWSVERGRSQRSETGARKNKPEETGGEAGRKASPQVPLRSFAPVFSRSAISRDLSTIQKGTACSLCLELETLYSRDTIG